MSATTLVEGTITDHPKKITEVQDEDIISLIHKDLQVQLKIIEKNLEIERVREENLSMKLQIIEARLKRCKSDAKIKLLLRDISVLTQKIKMPQINIDQINNETAN